jgi:proteic killer suppression protein
VFTPQVKCLPPLRGSHRTIKERGANHELTDLASPPGNRLEALKGNLAGYHSIRINDQWRVVFRWTGSGPDDVDILDYH